MLVIGTSLMGRSIDHGQKNIDSLFSDEARCLLTLERPSVFRDALRTALND